MRKTYIDTSQTEGKGVFLNKDVTKDEIILRFAGKVIKNPPGNWREGPNWLQVGYTSWIIPKPDSHGSFLNHSCSPNAGLRGRSTIVAMEPIKKGEEVLFDYALVESYPLWYMKCYCGAKNCRKIVKPYQDLSAQRKKKYEKYTAKYIRDMKLYMSWEEYLSHKK